MPTIDDALKVAEASEKGGSYAAVLILLIVVGGIAALWFLERKERIELGKELRAETKEVTTALNQNTTALDQLKELLKVALNK